MTTQRGNWSLLNDVTNTDLNMTSGEINSTQEACTNEYCVSDEEYLDILIAYLKPTPGEWVVVLAYVIVFFVGLIGNFLVCFVVWKNKSMHTVTNYFIGEFIKTEISNYEIHIPLYHPGNAPTSS